MEKNQTVNLYTVSLSAVRFGDSGRSDPNGTGDNQLVRHKYSPSQSQPGLHAIAQKRTVRSV